jgi:hypothetical protein
MNRNGAKGTDLCFFINPYAIPNAHADTVAIDNPFIPSHNPATESNLTSPNPIACFFEVKANRANPIAYPKIAAVICSASVPNAKRPDRNSGHNHTSGIMRLFKSSLDMKSMDIIEVI